MEGSDVRDTRSMTSVNSAEPSITVGLLPRGFGIEEFEK